MVLVDVGQEVELLHVEFVADETFERLPRVSGGKMQLQLCGGGVHHAALSATGSQLPMFVGTKLVIVHGALTEIRFRFAVDLGRRGKESDFFDSFSLLLLVTLSFCPSQTPYWRECVRETGRQYVSLGQFKGL